MGRRGRALVDGLRLRCPACRTGRLSPRWWTVTRMHERCPACDIPFVPGRGESVGGVEAAVYATALVGSLGMMALVVARAPVPWLVAWVLGVGVLGPLLTYRHFRGMWLGTMWGLQAWSRDGDAPRSTPRVWPWDD